MRRLSAMLLLVCAALLGCQKPVRPLQVALPDASTPDPSPTAPGAPSSVQAVAGTASATVSWAAPEDHGSALLSYRILVLPSGPSATVSAPATSTTLTGLAHQHYTFAVFATNAVGEGPASAPSNDVVPVTTASAPNQLTAEPGTGQIQLSWAPPSDDGGSAILRYRITRSPDGAITETDGPVTSAVLTGIPRGTFTFALRAITALGEGAAVTSDALDVKTLPGAPTGVTAEAGVAAAKVRWVAPSDDGGSALTHYTVSAGPGGPTEVVPATSTQAVLTGLTDGASYQFTVVASSAVGDGAVSEPSAAMVPAPVTSATGIVTAFPAKAFASGYAPITLHIRAVDALQRPVAGVPVKVSSSDPGDLLSPAETLTSTAGTATVQVTGTSVGTRTFTVQVGDDTQTVAGELVAACSGPAFSFQDSSPVLDDYDMSFVTADVNGDGVPDLVIGDGEQTGNALEVMLGRGDGTFGTGVRYSVHVMPTDGPADFMFVMDLVTGDFDDDGRPDVAVLSILNEGYSLSILHGNGDGTFGPPTEMLIDPAICPPNGALVTGDFNGDGYTDLAITTQPFDGSGPAEAYLHVLLGGADGSLVALAAMDLGPPGGAGGADAVPVAVGDANTDGIPDLFLANLGGGYRVLLGVGDGTFTDGSSSSNDPGATLDVADYNRDGLTDLALQSGTINVRLGAGNGVLADATSYPGNPPMKSADLDGDGWLDFATVGGVLRGTGGGQFADALVPYSVPDGVLHVRIADFDGDGKPDLAFDSPWSKRIDVFLNTCQ